MEWLSSARYRYPVRVDTARQLGYAKRIAAVDGARERKLLLELLELVERADEQTARMKDEFELIRRALGALDAKLTVKAGDTKVGCV